MSGGISGTALRGKWNLAGERYRLAVSRAYYACHHAARACLKRQGITLLGRDPHSGVSNLFGLYLVLSGLFPRWMGRVLNELYRQRLRADYRPEVAITSGMASLAVADAKAFLQEVKDKRDKLR